MSDSVSKYYEMMKDGDPTVRKVVGSFSEKKRERDKEIRNYLSRKSIIFDRVVGACQRRGYGSGTLFTKSNR